MMAIKNLLYKIGLIDSKRLEAREGEYKNVFCPHCGEFIPHKYTVLVESSVGDDGMTFDCPNCERSGAVMRVVEYEPLVEHEPSVGRQNYEAVDDSAGDPTDLRARSDDE